MTDENCRERILVCELWQGEAVQQRAIATFAPTKHLQLEDPVITVQVERTELQMIIHLQSTSLARFVELAFEGTDIIFSDNYFDLPAGRATQVTCPLPTGGTLDQARSALKVRSVIDSYTPPNLPHKTY